MYLCPSRDITQAEGFLRLMCSLMLTLTSTSYRERLIKSKYWLTGSDLPQIMVRDKKAILKKEKKKRKEKIHLFKGEPQFLAEIADICFGESQKWQVNKVWQYMTCLVKELSAYLLANGVTTFSFCCPGGITSIDTRGVLLSGGEDRCIRLWKPGPWLWPRWGQRDMCPWP